jgi:hypothetical protein
VVSRPKKHTGRTKNFQIWILKFFRGHTYTHAQSLAIIKTCDPFKRKFTSTVKSCTERIGEGTTQPNYLKRKKKEK